jgi:hypothetical protein
MVASGNYTACRLALFNKANVASGPHSFRRVAESSPPACLTAAGFLFAFCDSIDTVIIGIVA